MDDLSEVSNIIQGACLYIIFVHFVFGFVSLCRTLNEKTGLTEVYIKAVKTPKAK